VARSLPERLTSFFRSRGQAIGIAATLALFVRLGRNEPPEPSAVGIRTLLEAASKTTVRPGDTAWEPSRGALLDLFSGRPVLFLGGEPGSP
jgi:hypothetical protein